MTATAIRMHPETDLTATRNVLTERALIVALHLSMWQGQRLDRQVTDAALGQAQASKDAGKFEKYLVPKSALEPVNKAHTRARQRHYQLTLPWGDDSSRILSSAAFFDYSQAMDEERANCERAYREFLAAYPQHLAEAPARLGKMYNRGDFPSPGELAQKFGFNLVLLPVPDSGDLRVSLGADVEERVRRSIEETVTERAASAQRDLWERLFETLKHFAGTMAKSDKVFRNSTVEKLVDLARLAPKLSLQPDPRLEAVCGDLVQLLAGVNADSLRQNELLRARTATDAKAALAKIEDAMRGVLG